MAALSFLHVVAAHNAYLIMAKPVLCIHFLGMGTPVLCLAKEASAIAPGAGYLVKKDKDRNVAYFPS
ncbi:MULTISPECIES: hypothetical protein [Geobacillus]|uniref:hypothetical protein n=1 Tax=Geobacillus TaxID=129337 RepID=UPI0006DD2CE6|nr:MULTISPECIES: hypothetical protein [Geobacillus]KQC46084.1 hypothetical protein AP057_11585 [Geobacillus sp. Sah69]